jgi:hypothetical protein
MSAEDPQVPPRSGDSVAWSRVTYGDVGPVRTADHVDAEILKEISEWFQQHGLGWSGTLGELSANVGHPPAELMHALEVSSLALLISGIAASVSHRSGSPTMVSLRRLVDSRADYRDEVDISGPATAACDGGISEILPSNCELQLPATGCEHDGIVSEDSLGFDGWRSELVLQTLTPLREESCQGKHWWKRKYLAAVFIILFVVGLLANVVKKSGFAFLSAKSSHGAVAQVAKVRATYASPAGIQNELAFLYEESKAGNATAEYVLGRKLLRAEGVREDRDQALKWLCDSAKRGNKDAQLELGKAYSSGQGLSKDNVEAYTWLTLLASQKNSEAQTLVRELTPELTTTEIARVRWKLGEMYRQGIGVHQNRTIAFTWYVLAEAAGEKRSIASESELASLMSPAQLSVARANAIRWLRQHQL